MTTHQATSSSYVPLLKLSGEPTSRTNIALRACIALWGNVGRESHCSSSLRFMRRLHKPFEAGHDVRTSKVLKVLDSIDDVNFFRDHSAGRGLHIEDRHEMSKPSVLGALQQEVYPLRRLVSTKYDATAQVLSDSIFVNGQSTFLEVKVRKRSVSTEDIRTVAVFAITSNMQAPLLARKMANVASSRTAIHGRHHSQSSSSFSLSAPD